MQHIWGGLHSLHHVEIQQFSSKALSNSWKLSKEVGFVINKQYFNVSELYLGKFTNVSFWRTNAFDHLLLNDLFGIPELWLLDQIFDCLYCVNKITICNSLLLSLIISFRCFFKDLNSIDTCIVLFNTLLNRLFLILTLD